MNLKPCYTKRGNMLDWIKKLLRKTEEEIIKQEVGHLPPSEKKDVMILKQNNSTYYCDYKEGLYEKIQRHVFEGNTFELTLATGGAVFLNISNGAIECSQLTNIDITYL